MRNEYKELKRENDMIFSTLMEYDRDSISDIINTIDNTRGIGYDVELVRKDLIAMAANAEAQNSSFTAVIGDMESFKCELLASIPHPKLMDYMADSLVWLAVYSFVISLVQMVFNGLWASYYDLSALAMCILIMMPSAWLLQHIIPTSWLTAKKRAGYTAAQGLLLTVWFVEFVLLYRFVGPLLPKFGIPNIVSFVLFGALVWVLRTWRTSRYNKLAATRPWQNILDQ